MGTNFCPNCGIQVSGTNFCANCGASLSSVRTQKVHVPKREVEVSPVMAELIEGAKQEVRKRSQAGIRVDYVDDDTKKTEERKYKENLAAVIVGLGSKLLGEI